MPGGGRVDEVACSRFVLPLFEGRDADLHRQAREVAPRALGELRAELDADDREAALEERTRGLARRATDLEQPVVGLELAQLDEIVEELLRIRGPRLVIEVGGRVERAPEVVRCAHARPIVSKIDRVHSLRRVRA